MTPAGQRERGQSLELSILSYFFRIFWLFGSFRVRLPTGSWPQDGPSAVGWPANRSLHRCAALHHGSAHHLARVTLSQQLKFCRTSWQFHFCANDADDALRLLLVMGTHRRTGEIPSVPDSRSGLAHQPEELVLEALLAEIPAANNS